MALNRRSALKLGVSASVTALALPWSRAASAPTAVRYSATSPRGKAMLVKYAQAVGLMMDKAKYPESDPRSWTFQWYTHWIPGPSGPWRSVVQRKQEVIENVFAGAPPTDPHRQMAEAMWGDCQAHGSNPSDPNMFQLYLFCVWHRWYVYYFEQIVRAVLADDSFTLPYWDYLSGDVADLSLPPEFRDTTSKLYRASRNSWVNNGERIDKQNPGTLTLDALKEPMYLGAVGGFCRILNNNPHGLVHGYVGTTANMGSVPSAAGDPIFWLHHANIDRIWESWNRRQNCVNPNWPDRDLPFADRNGSLVTVKPAGANRVASLGYEYDSYAKVSSPPSCPSTAVNLSLAAPPVTVAYAASPVELSDNRVRVGLANPASLIAPGADLVRAPGPTRQMYLQLGNISAPADTASTYNVFLSLPESADNPGPDDPHFVGTLQFFDASGHAASHGGHQVAFNVTDTVRALKKDNALTGAPTVTLIRYGEPESAKPIVGQVSLTEI